MRIAICSTNEIPMQVPRGMIYAPAASRLLIAQELAKRGHDVTLYCSEDTAVEAPLKKVSCGVDSIYKQRLDNPDKTFASTYVATTDHILYAEMYARAKAGEHDIILASNPFRVMPFVAQATIPTLITLHDALELNHTLLPYFAKYNNHSYITISNAQRTPLPELRYETTIYHGIDVATLPYEEKPDDYFIYFGRMVKEKGVLDSIAVAKQAGVKLKLVGPHFQSEAAAAYWQQIEAHIDGEQIEYLGALGKDELFPIVAKAKGFINMIEYPEAFGMVLIESMACGTPVIARARGSIPEVVDNHGTGFVVETVEQGVEAVKNIASISRAFCRQYVADRFGFKNYVDQYEKVLGDVLTRS